MPGMQRRFWRLHTSRFSYCIEKAPYIFMLQCPAKDTMKRFWILTLTGLFLLASCGSPSAGLSSQKGTLVPLTGRVKTTIIRSQDLDIAVMVASPQTPRYAEGAGVVVVASPIFTETNGFGTDPDLTSLGLIQVSYLWPGRTDARTS